MIGTILRLLWRVFVALVAAGLAYATVFLFYPYIRDHTPLLATVIILYILIAYFGIPFLVRLWRLVIHPNHLPHYAVSRDGWSSDPINLAIVCHDEAALRSAMEKAGWCVADKPTLKNILHEGYAIFFNQPYKTAPFSNLFLLGRKQDIGFQIPTGSSGSPRHRHHIRFWRINETPEETHHHVPFWESIFQIFPRKKKQIWIGAATHDVSPFAIRAQNLQITHKIDAETNRERDFVIRTLQEARLVKRSEVLAAGDPVVFKGQAFGVNIITDGTLPVIELK